MSPERTGLLYEGKSKRVYETTSADRVILQFKDDATAFNGVKHAEIAGKGVMNAQLSAFFMDLLAKNGVKHHLIEVLSDTEQLCERVDVMMVEVVVRNVVAGSFARRYGLDEGHALPGPLVEFFVKSDPLDDPLIGHDAAVALGLAQPWELRLAKDQALLINQVLRDFWAERNVDLVDFKVEFGRTTNGMLVLADEISPDGCRLWEQGTGRKLDKDVFRRDLGDLAETYREVVRRATGGTE